MERIIVGTGRCGSTMLSNMLAKHPNALIISEFLGAVDRTNGFNAEPVTPEQFKAVILAEMPVPLLAMHRGLNSREVLAEVDTSAEFKIPGICFVALPALSDKPQELLGELLALVDSFPTQTMTEHYRCTFAWLQKKFGKTSWIERTGSSIEFMPELYRTFPDAKYVHIHRDGPDAALSMRNHFYFQLLVSFFCKPATREELEQTELAGAPIRADDPISRRLGAELPSIEQFAEYWNYQLEVGYQTFAKLDAAQYLDVRFEDLVGNPRSELKRIADFFEIADGAWIEAAAGMANASEITSSMAKLSPEQQASLLKTCQPGRILLGRYQHPWIHPTLQLIKDVNRDFAAKS